MNRNLLLIGIIVILIIVGVVGYKILTKEEENPPKIAMPGTLENKKIAMIIAFRNFRDAEYFVPKEILEETGAKITTVSTKKGTAIGADGGDTEVDISIEEVNPADFDGIVFIGGPGALDYLDNEKSYNIAKETVKAEKILGAICVSPMILAKAGVLSGKKATVWSSPLDKGPVKILKDNGAIYEDEKVVIDGKIVTANGPEAAEEFAKALIEGLTGK